MSTSLPSSVSLTKGRLLTLLFLFAFLGMYLWGIQLAYDKAINGWTKALLFSLIIFGGGLSWDVLKEIARLPDRRMAAFAISMRQTLVWMLVYAAGFVVGVLVLGPWAGIATAGLVFYWLLTAWALYKFFVSFDGAVNSALAKNDAT